MHTYSLLRTQVRRSRQILKHKVSTDVSLSTETSPTAESIAMLNPIINLEKYKHPYQVEI
jgi:hypothetical protein